jgi:hypothetical protein
MISRQAPLAYPFVLHILPRMTLPAVRLRPAGAGAGTFHKGSVTAWRRERPVLQETMQ